MKIWTSPTSCLRDVEPAELALSREKVYTIKGNMKYLLSEDFYFRDLTFLAVLTKTHYLYIYIDSFSCRFYPKRLTIAIYVRGHMPLEQLGVKCLTQGHTGVSQWI